MTTPAPFAKVALAFAGIYLIWGTTYLAIALSIQTLPPFSSGAMRFLIAAALLYAWLRARDPRPFAGIDLKRTAVCGVLLTGFGNGLVVWAQQGVPSGIAALLIAAAPIFILGVEYLFFAGQLPTLRAATGMMLALLSVGIIVANTQTLAGTARPMYVAAILVALLAWSIGTLLQRRTGVTPDRVLAFTCAQVFFGALLQLTLAIINREWTQFHATDVSLTSMLALLYLVVFGSIVALSCYSWLLTQVAPQKVATYALVNPVVALFLGALVLDESLNSYVLMAVIGVLAGIALVLFPKVRWPKVRWRAARVDS